MNRKASPPLYEKRATRNTISDIENKIETTKYYEYGK